jgi:hypothetical protein
VTRNEGCQQLAQEIPRRQVDRKVQRRNALKVRSSDRIEHKSFFLPRKMVLPGILYTGYE